jgi:hypothetical protein
MAFSQKEIIFLVIGVLLALAAVGVGVYFAQRKNNGADKSGSPLAPGNAPAVVPVVPSPGIAPAVVPVVPSPGIAPGMAPEVGPVSRGPPQTQKLTWNQHTDTTVRDTPVCTPMANPPLYNVWLAMYGIQCSNLDYLY